MYFIGLFIANSARDITIKAIAAINWFVAPNMGHIFFQSPNARRPAIETTRRVAKYLLRSILILKNEPKSSETIYRAILVAESRVVITKAFKISTAINLPITEPKIGFVISP
ncbi:MAG: hypothetical protein BWY26_01052 [Elusimicrobia bacterium ADurb.Bin231]|nr:MAG: hypothetical protein BWY26_01052 [Elusimicrobia bacterium ADurb.Bin231]